MRAYCGEEWVYFSEVTHTYWWEMEQELAHPHFSLHRARVPEENMKRCLLCAAKIFKTPEGIKGGKICKEIKIFLKVEWHGPPIDTTERDCNEFRGTREEKAWQVISECTQENSLCKSLYLSLPSSRESLNLYVNF